MTPWNTRRLETHGQHVPYTCKRLFFEEAKQSQEETDLILYSNIIFLSILGFKNEAYTLGSFFVNEQQMYTQSAIPLYTSTQRVTQIYPLW